MGRQIPHHSAPHPASSSGACQPLGPSTPGDASHWVLSLSLPTFCRQHAFLDASPGRGAAEHVPLLLQQVQATVSSIAGRAEGNIPTYPAGREVYTEGTNAGTFAAVTAWDRVHGMRQGSGVSWADGWEPRAGGKADADTSGVSHPEGKCSASCLRR